MTIRGLSCCIGAVTGFYLMLGCAREAPSRPASATLSQTSSQIVLTVPGAGSGPAAGYKLRIARRPVQLITERAGEPVLSSTAGDQSIGPVRFQVGGSWYQATSVTSASWTGAELDLALATSSAQHRVVARITPLADRYRLSYEVQGPGSVTRLGPVYRLASARHWYGQGEVGTNTAPWPLDSGEITTSISPTGGFVTDPFWYTESGVGLWLDTRQTIDTSVNAGADGLGQFYAHDGSSIAAEVFVARTPREAFLDYVGVVGKPSHSDTTYTQYRAPLWNEWPQYYLTVDQNKILAYAKTLARQRLPAHAVQIDGGWEANRGDLAFDPVRFPDPPAMSKEIHKLGFNEGVWVSFYIAANAATFDEAQKRGYLLAEAGNPGKPCVFAFARSTAPGHAAGMVDLANPAARAWFSGKLHDLERTAGVDGVKFDYPNIPSQCAPRAGYSLDDYPALEADLARSFDLQGAGVRLHWGSQRYGFALREADSFTDWRSLQAAVPEAMAVSTIGYPFVETDTVGGSAGGVAITAAQPPDPHVLVRWAQAASLMPLMTGGTLPTGHVGNPYNGKAVTYDASTTQLYRAAIERHQRLAPYIWAEVRAAVATGEPIVKPLFFDFPEDQSSYTIDDEWLLGDAVLAAPAVTDAQTRSVHIPRGRWLDVARCRMLTGPLTMPGYPTPLDRSPVFVRLGIRGQTELALAALDGCPGS